MKMVKCYLNQKLLQTRIEGRMIVCFNCRLKYNRDLNFAINIARQIMSPSGWERSEPPKPSYKAVTVKRGRTEEAPSFGVERLMYIN
ncbi:MAG TPA: hypothetical protein EYH09_02035 [Candidatus Nanopusillus sp.]|nr:hypothetical protein [Candidatus Nanopusillus sp.]